MYGTKIAQQSDLNDEMISWNYDKIMKTPYMIHVDTRTRMYPIQLCIILMIQTYRENEHVFLSHVCIHLYRQIQCFQVQNAQNKTNKS